MGTCMEVQVISALVNVNQWDDVGPSIPIHRAYMSDLLFAQELSSCRVWHEPFAAENVPAQVRYRYRCHRLPHMSPCSTPSPDLFLELVSSLQKWNESRPWLLKSQTWLVPISVLPLLLCIRCFFATPMCFILCASRHDPKGQPFPRYRNAGIPIERSGCDPRRDLPLAPSS
jgi:hypothetical protein